MNEIRYLAPTQPTQYPVNYPAQPGQWQAVGAQPGLPAMPGQENNNLLIRAAEPLLILITQIRHTIDHPDVESLRNQIIEEIKIFERNLSQLNYPARTIISARYCICTAIDETVLGQPWGTQSIWVQGSLLSIFQKETWGGERFYIILEDALRDIRGNIDFIELIYFLISLGFEGKFYGEEYRAAREEIRNRIFYHIRHARAKPERNLSLNWKLATIPTTMNQRRALLKRTAVISGSILLVLAIFYNIGLYHKAAPTLDKLNNLGTVSPVTIFSQVIERPIIARHDDEGEE